jgi:hypothetical protein
MAQISKIVCINTSYINVYKQHVLTKENVMRVVHYPATFEIFVEILQNPFKCFFILMFLLLNLLIKLD